MQYTDYDRRMTEVGHSQHQKTETLESSGTLRILKEHLDAKKDKSVARVPMHIKFTVLKLVYVLQNVSRQKE